MRLLAALVAVAAIGLHQGSTRPAARRTWSSLATGSYTETHGLLGNNIIPPVNATLGLDAGSRENLEAVAARRRLAAHHAVACDGAGENSANVRVGRSVNFRDTPFIVLIGRS